MGSDTGPLLAGQKAFILLRLDGILTEENADAFDDALDKLLTQFGGKRLGTSYRSDPEEVQ